MKKALLAGVSVVALSCSAYAADMPVKARPLPAPVASWTGPYIGIQGGYVSHEGEFEDEHGFLEGVFFPDGSRRSTPGKTEAGGFVGGHLGYNWQSGRIVFGIEGDISGVWAKGKRDTGNEFDDSSVVFDVKWLATVRGRLGVLAGDMTLLYVTAGVAFADVRNNAANDTFSINMIEDRIKTGWTVGGGIEHMFARNWTVRAEVRYTDLGDKSVRCSPPSNGNCSSFSYRGEFSNTLLQGLVGVSLKF